MQHTPSPHYSPRSIAMQGSPSQHDDFLHSVPQDDSSCLQDPLGLNMFDTFNFGGADDSLHASEPNSQASFSSMDYPASWSPSSPLFSQNSLGLGGIVPPPPVGASYVRASPFPQATYLDHSHDLLNGHHAHTSRPPVPRIQVDTTWSTVPNASTSLDPRSPLSFKRSPTALVPLTPSSYGYPSPSSAESYPLNTPPSAYDHRSPFGTPDIRKQSSSPHSPGGLSISPSELEQKIVLVPPQQGRDDTHQRVLVFAQHYPHPFGGELVPQTDYRPHTQSDRRRYVEQVQLEPPILFFTQHPTGLGIPLKDAISSRFMQLVDRDDSMFEGRGPSVSIRLNWPGYAPWTRQIPTKDFRSPPHPITRSKLARNVAKVIKRFIDETQDLSQEDETMARWRVGKNYIKLEDLMLVGLQHVSMGSWQAHVRLMKRH
ncbi:hypothetical protein C8Q79DRAFT_131748 [Trametes meyenii]|nr:hypothetical protein C8Q79DRAFT_131748 [Trametes meyenii]